MAEIVVLDEGKMLEKINDLPNQLEKAWTSLWTKDLGISFDKIGHILIVGMGGSGVAGSLAKELFADSPIAVSTWADYGLPGWVNEKTLVVTVSYSGDTEETLDAAKKALEKKTVLVAITSGGKLAELAELNKFPVIKIDYDSPPRAAIGWLYGSLLTLLAKGSFIPLTDKQYLTAVEELKKAIKLNVFPAKAEDLAITLNNKVPLVVASAPLATTAHRWVTQLNENSKTFSMNAAFPELCHNLLVGLDFSVVEKLSVLCIKTRYGFSRNVVREKITQDWFTKKNIPFTPLTMQASSALAEQLLFIYFGDLLSFYLAGVNGVDPTPIESITFLKEQLGKV